MNLPKILKMLLLRDHKVFYENQSIRGWKKNYPINSKIIIKKNWSHVRLPCKSLNFRILRYPSKKSKNYANPKT
jgi:hypothetical protein